MDDFNIEDITGPKSSEDITEIIKALTENKNNIKNIVCAYEPKDADVTAVWQGETFMGLIGLSHHIGHCVEEEWNRAEGC